MKLLNHLIIALNLNVNLLYINLHTSLSRDIHSVYFFTLLKKIKKLLAVSKQL